MIKANFDFKLSQPIKVHDDGLKTFDKLTLYRPAIRHTKYTLQIKQAFMNGVMNMESVIKTKPDTSVKQKPMKDGDIITLLMGTKCDIVGLFENFKQLLYLDICKIDDRISFTEFHYEQMEPDDIESLLDKYMLNFLVSSLGLGK